MPESSLKKRLAWQCRRGMLELDVILLPFLEEHFSQLNETQQNLFSDLLKEADPDIYTWLMGFGRCQQPALAEIVALIQQKMQL